MRELLPWLALIFQRPRRLLAGAGLILLTLLSGIALLAVSGWFITETALVGLLLAAGVQASVNLYVPGGAIRFFAVSRTVARYLERVYNHDTVLRLLTDIRVALFRRLARTGPTARYRMSSAQWLSRLTTDVDALDTLYLRLIAPAALALVVSLLVALLAWILIDGRAALLVAVCCLAAFVLATVGVHRRCHAMAATQSEQLEQLRTGVIEHLDGFSELTASGQLHPQATALLEEAGRINQHQARVESRVGWHQAGTQLLINLSAVLVLWLGIEVMGGGPDLRTGTGADAHRHSWPGGGVRHVAGRIWQARRYPGIRFPADPGYPTRCPGRHPRSGLATPRPCLGGPGPIGPASGRDPRHHPFGS